MRESLKLPVVLSPDEVGRFLEPIPSLKARAGLKTAYAAGLRASEVVGLKVGPRTMHPWCLGFVGLAAASGLAKLPAGLGCGIGFAMSRFVAGLAFEHGSGNHFGGDRLGILAGLVLSALAVGSVMHCSWPLAAARR